MKKKVQEKFSIKARICSIGYAWQGIISFFKTEHNAFVHLLFTILVIAATFIWNVSWIEGAVLVLIIGFVWVAEIFNTAIEAMMDHLSADRHPAVKYIKDVSAAAVLVSAFTAVVVGLIIFIPKIV